MSYIEQFLEGGLDPYKEAVSRRRQAIYDYITTLPADKCFPSGWMDDELRTDMGFEPTFEWVEVTDPRPGGTQTLRIAAAVAPPYEEDGESWLVTLVGDKAGDWAELGSLFLNDAPFISIQTSIEYRTSHIDWESVDAEIFLGLAEQALGLNK